MERAVAERLESGAMTASSMPSISSSARRSACSPSAAMPSSLVRRIFIARRDASGASRRSRGVPASRHRADTFPHERDAVRYVRGMSTTTHDVVVVGGSTAGCTAARLYALAGARVALVERRPSMDAYKVTCTHYIQASATPVFE